MDAWLLDTFPGRTLEELDGMDWIRFMRAQEARNVMAVESVRLDVIRKRTKPENLLHATLEAIESNEKLMELWQESSNSS